MRICRYDDDRIGLVRDGSVHDATDALSALPPLAWPVPLGDHFIRHLEGLKGPLEAAADKGTVKPVDEVTLRSPVANPSKIIGAPVNYAKHIEEAEADPDLSYGKGVTKIEQAGLFLKANSALAGPGDGIRLRYAERRNDHEVELAVIIGKEGNEIPESEAMSYIAGYAIGLDITVRGGESRSFRKSVDTYAVVGPWMVTGDEIADPGHLDLSISVNGEMRQSSNTSFLIFDIPRLINFASSFYTLYPGDVIMTGTPEGVGPIADGDTLVASVEGVGEMTLSVREQ